MRYDLIWFYQNFEGTNYLTRGCIRITIPSSDSFIKEFDLTEEELVAVALAAEKTTWDEYDVATVIGLKMGVTVTFPDPPAPITPEPTPEPTP